MTTIIVVAIVALVFFVAISVAAFMTWRQETRMRTDSLRGIEISLNEVLDGFSQRAPVTYHAADDIGHGVFSGRKDKRAGLKRSKRKRAEFDEEGDEYDPFSWANKEPGIDVTVFRPSDLSTKSKASKKRTEEPKDKQPSVQELPEENIRIQAEPVEEKLNEDNSKDNKKGNTKSNADLSFIDIDDLFDLDEILFENVEHDRTEDYNTGRSGRKYTAEELESLIKE